MFAQTSIGMQNLLFSYILGASASSNLVGASSMKPQKPCKIKGSGVFALSE